MPAEDHLLREQLTELLRGGEAHTNIASALEGFPADKRAVKPAGSPHNAWQLLEHMRLALDDLLDFCENSNYLAPKFPEGYWPRNEKPSTEEWDRSVTAVVAALKQFEDLVANHEFKSLRENPLGRWADSTARSSHCGRPHELSPRTIRAPAQTARRLERVVEIEIDVDRTA